MFGERKRIILQLIIGLLGATVGLICVIAFNQYVLSGLPLGLRMICMIVTYWLIAIVPFVIILFEKDYLSAYGFDKEKIGLQILVGIIIGSCLSFVLTFIPVLMGKGDWVDNGKRYQYLWQFGFEFVYYIVAVGLVEEFVFRGFIFSKVKALGNSTVVAIIISSILFGLFHLASGNIVQIILTGLLGVFFCICKEKINNCTLLSLVIAHGIHDTLITACASLL